MIPLGIFVNIGHITITVMLQIKFRLIFNKAFACNIYRERDNSQLSFVINVYTIQL